MTSIKLIYLLKVPQLIQYIYRNLASIAEIILKNLKGFDNKEADTLACEKRSHPYGNPRFNASTGKKLGQRIFYLRMG
jgi:hypothetical protein